MKKLLFFIYLFCVSLITNAQDLISKIPSDAKAVVALKGENITELVSVSEFENSRIGRLFLKELRQETKGKVTNLNELGIDVNRSFYYFMTSDSTAFSHNFLIPLKNKEGFETLMPNSQKKKIVREGNLSYTVSSYDKTVTMWNDKMLLVTFAQGDDKRYGRYSSYDDYGSRVEDATEAVTVEVKPTKYPIMTFYEKEYDFGDIIDGDVVKHVFKFKNTGNANLLIKNASASCGCTVPSYPKNALVPGASGEITVKFNSSGKSNQQTKSITISANTENGTERLKIKTFIHPKGSKINRKIVEDVEEIEETIIESTEVEEVEIEETVIESARDTSESVNSNRYTEDYYEKRRKEREAIALERNKDLIASAKATMNGNYVTGTILKNPSFVKAYGSGKDEALAWVGDFSSIYTDLLLMEPSLYRGLGYTGLFNGFSRLYGNTSLTSKLNFEKTKATLKTSYTMNSEVADYTRAMYNGKMNSNFFKYFNEDKMLGYFSVNGSTKGALQAYPDLLNSIFEGSSDNEVATFLPIGTKLFSLLLDEEGAAKILRGDMLFVLTEIKDREVSYKTYEYDDNYNRKEVSGTKTEKLPGFLMMVTSTEKDLFHRLMNAAVKESRGKITKSENGMYILTDKEFPFNINIIFKDNAVIIGSSEADMAAINKGNYKGNVGSTHKKLISKNSSVVYVNGKEIASEFPRDLMPRELKDRIDYISANTEDVIFRTGKVKGNTLDGEMILNTPEKGNKNSLAYFLNMINALID